jgi:hypothetical protein
MGTYLGTLFKVETGTSFTILESFRFYYECNYDYEIPLFGYTNSSILRLITDSTTITSKKSRARNLVVKYIQYIVIYELVVSKTHT